MKTNILCFLLSLLLFVGTANATYTDYIGAGHYTDVSVTQSSVDETATGFKTVDGSGLSSGGNDA